MDNANVPFMIPSEYRKEVPNLWSITRFSGKSTLAEAETETQARALYYQVASLVPELDPAGDPVTSVRSVACIAIKQHQLDKENMHITKQEA